mgnify:CR=1 FL=1
MHCLFAGYCHKLSKVHASLAHDMQTWPNATCAAYSVPARMPTTQGKITEHSEQRRAVRASALPARPKPLVQACRVKLHTALLAGDARQLPVCCTDNTVAD